MQSVSGSSDRLFCAQAHMESDGDAVVVLAKCIGDNTCLVGLETLFEKFLCVVFSFQIVRLN